MQLPLVPTISLADHLTSEQADKPPPLAFIDDEPFLLELQGSLDPPKGEDADTTEQLGGMSGVRVGKLDLENPKKPILRIAHHRLEGKVEKLATPYALLRTRPNAGGPVTPLESSSFDADSGRPAKRARTSPPPPSTDTLTAASVSKRIEIVALIRNKLVFSKRPEPLIDVSSEADPTFETRKRAALESNKGVKGPRGAAAAAAAVAATANGASASADGAEKGARPDAAAPTSTSAPKPVKAGLGKASSFFAPMKPVAAVARPATDNGS
ncbi:hypothetical protein JCM10908_006267 [Rhodotorula pacifica]|uniref:Ctf8 family protein n=1 Tax=Rhodotorula pacifica TaxID=1495444 RepID=UPI003173C0BA